MKDQPDCKLTTIQTALYVSLIIVIVLCYSVSFTYGGWLIFLFLPIYIVILLEHSHVIVKAIFLFKWRVNKIIISSVLIFIAFIFQYDVGDGWGFMPITELLGIVDVDTHPWWPLETEMSEAPGIPVLYNIILFLPWFLVLRKLIIENRGKVVTNKKLSFAANLLFYLMPIVYVYFYF